MERKFTIGKKGSVWTVYDSHAALHVQDCGEGDKGHAEAKATCESWNARRIVVNVPPTRCKSCFTITEFPVDMKHRITKTIASRLEKRDEVHGPWQLAEAALKINETIRRNNQSKNALKTLGFDSDTLGTEWDGETELTAGMTVSGGILLYLDARNAIIKTDTGFTTMKREDVKPVTFRDGVTLGEAEEIERLAKIAYESVKAKSGLEWDYLINKNHYVTIAETLRKEILK